MLIYIKLCVFLYLADVCLAGAFRYDYHRSSELGIWFKYHEDPATWRQARASCRAEGARLAWPASPQHQKEMIELVRQQREDQKTFYVGIHDILSIGVFVADNGTPLYDIPHRWGPEYYPNRTQPQCVTLGQDGYIRQNDCHKLFTYVCFKRENIRQIEKDGCDTGYEFNNNTGSCYKLYKEEQTWLVAYTTCMEEGAHLAFIKSDAEVNSLYYYFGVSGFHRLIEENHYETLEGEPVAVLGIDEMYLYDNDKINMCGGVFEMSSLSNIFCNKPYPFVCEKKRVLDNNCTNSLCAVQVIDPR